MLQMNYDTLNNYVISYSINPLYLAYAYYKYNQNFKYFEIKKSKSHDYGVFATKDFHEGEILFTFDTLGKDVNDFNCTLSIDDINELKKYSSAMYKNFVKEYNSEFSLRRLTNIKMYNICGVNFCVSTRFIYAGEELSRAFGCQYWLDYIFHVLNKGIGPPLLSDAIPCLVIIMNLVDEQSLEYFHAIRNAYPTKTTSMKITPNIF